LKFLDKKEQVIDIELTPHGKSLLSKGKFKPEFYAFYDDNVLYDSQYGGFSETQNSSSLRIKDMPQMEPQTYFFGAESESRLLTDITRFTQQDKAEVLRSNLNLVESLSTPSVSIPVIPDREFYGVPLGSSELNSSNAPAWKISVLKGEIDSSSPSLDNWGNVQKIPQINMKDITYSFKLLDEIRTTFAYPFGETNDELSGKTLNIFEDSIVLEVSEENVQFDFENFDIQVFEVEKVPQTGSAGNVFYKEILIPLAFKGDTDLVQDGILLDPEEVVERDVPLNPNYVEYYFDVDTDNEIDAQILCELGPSDEAQGIFSSRVLDCQELDEGSAVDIEGLYDGENFEDECGE